MSKIFSSEGIVFRTLKYSETSIIADIYTYEKGLRSFIISGVRSAKAGSKASILRPCNIVQLIAYEQDTEKLSRMKDVNLTVYYKNINTNVFLSSIAIFILEICRNAIREKEPNPEMYDFLKNWYLYIDANEHNSNVLHLKFLLDFSYYLGFGPLQNYSSEACVFDMLEGNFSQMCDIKSINLIEADLSLLIARLLETERENLQALGITKDQRNTIIDKLLYFYKLHIMGFRDIRSLDILRSVF